MTEPVAPPGSVEPASPASPLPQHLGVVAYEQARARLLTALRGGSARQRAVLWMIEPADAATATVPPHTALAGLARSSHDAVIWRWATARCQGAPDCPDIAREWARADFGNAMPWLHVLNAEPAAAAPQIWDAMAQATRLQSHDGVLSATALQAWPADVPPYLSALLLTETMGVEAALSWPAFAPAVQTCGLAAAASHERARCEALIRTLVRGSDNLLGLAVGAKMAERAGWPQQQVASMRAELAGLQQQAAHAPWMDRQPLSCATVERLAADVRLRAQVGELGAARQRADERAAAGSGQR